MIEPALLICRGRTQLGRNSMSDATTGRLLKAPHTIAYAYRRSLGDVLGKFFTGLRDHKLLGIRNNDGKVLMPPCEYDPATGQALGRDFVEVGPGGTVTSWTWIAEPRPQHPLEKAFAFALIQLDGADTAMVHAVDAGSEDQMSTGMRVAPRWAEKTAGHIHDIASFVPEGSA
jgi:hypothetical protein